MEMENWREKLSWNHDSALPAERQQRGQGSRKANGHINSDPGACMKHTLIYNKRHTF